MTSYADEDASTAEGTPQGLLEEERLPNEAAAKVPRHLQLLQFAMGRKGDRSCCETKINPPFFGTTTRARVDVTTPPFRPRLLWFEDGCLFHVACNARFGIPIRDKILLVFTAFSCSDPGEKSCQRLAHNWICTVRELSMKCPSRFVETT